MKKLFYLIFSLLLISACSSTAPASGEKEQYKIAVKYYGMMTQAVLETSRVDETIEQKILDQKHQYDKIKNELPESVTSKMVILENGYDATLSSTEPELVNDAIDISVDLQFEFMKVLTEEEVQQIKQAKD